MGKKQKLCKTTDRAYRPYDRREIEMKKRKGKGKMNSFAWSIEQETLYVKFLRNNRAIVQNFEQRKKNRIFVMMSEYLQKRDPDQCRSHHQKMEKKYGNTDQIIQKITENKLNSLEAYEPTQNSIQSFKQISNTASQIKEQHNQMEDQTLRVNQTVCTPTDFQAQEKELWDCVVENVWSDD